MKHRILRTNKQRIAWTNTSRLTDAEVIEALKLTAKYANLDRTVVHVKSMGERRRSYGRAYYGIPLQANLTGLDAFEWHYLVIVTDHGQNALTGRSLTPSVTKRGTSSSTAMGDSGGKNKIGIVKLSVELSARGWPKSG